MNRRGHLSSKIPNVKIRPAPAPSASTRRRSARHHEEQEMSAMDAEILRQAWEGAEGGHVGAAEEGADVVQTRPLRALRCAR